MASTWLKKKKREKIVETFADFACFFKNVSMGMNWVTALRKKCDCCNFATKVPVLWLTSVKALYINFNNAFFQDRQSSHYGQKGIQFYVLFHWSSVWKSNFIVTEGGVLFFNVFFWTT